MRRDTIPNPSVRGGRLAVTVTDRALRYRATSNPPPGPQLCHYCGAQPAGRRPLDVEHVDGREENGRPENLSYACRSCNATKGAVFARAKIGRPTRQYNPGGARTLAQWRAAVAALKGQGRMPIADAIATVQSTPHAARAKFAVRLNPAGTVPTFEQYSFAVAGRNSSGAHDAAGKIIHATPKATRREYAREIWESRRQHGTTGRRSSAEEVPF